MEHSTYSASLALCDFFVFRALKNHLKRSHFEITEEIQEVMMAVLNSCRRMNYGSAVTVQNSAGIYL
jgi:hypothetical protein